MIAQLVDYLMNLAGHLGYLGIIFIVGLEYACFPLPSEIVLPFVGMGMASGTYGVVNGFLASILGAMFGTMIAYYIGYIGGVPLIEWSKHRFPKTKKTLIALDKWFNKYGNFAVFITRIFPLTRTYVSFLAGSQKLDLLSFMGYSFLGILGYFLGNNLDLIDNILKKYSVVACSMLILAVIYFVYKKLKEKKGTARV
ncbi:MAG: DedA family protein [Niameybacter sp.]